MCYPRTSSELSVINEKQHFLSQNISFVIRFLSFVIRRSSNDKSIELNARQAEERWVMWLQNHRQLYERAVEDVHYYTLKACHILLDTTHTQSTTNYFCSKAVQFEETCFSAFVRVHSECLQKQIWMNHLFPSQASLFSSSWHLQSKRDVGLQH